jgi:lysophospholipase L1-like esterase
VEYQVTRAGRPRHDELRPPKAAESVTHLAILLATSSLNSITILIVVSMAISQTVSPTRRRGRIFRIGATVILIAAFAGSLAANFFTYALAKTEYREMKSVRLDPLGVHEAKFPADLPAKAPAALPLVAFVGDSRAQAWWPPPSVKGWRFANRGIYGQTTEQILARYDVQVTPLKPRVVVLQAGINDLAAIGVFPDRRDRIVADCKRNLHAMIDRAAGGGSTVMVTTIFPVGHVPLERRPLWSNEIPGAVDEVNADLRAIHQPGVVVLDAWRLLQKEGRMRSEFSADLLHLKRAGYEVLNQALTNSLTSLNPPDR